MKTAIFFATREGQTRRIAERIATGVRATGREVDVVDLAGHPRITWSDYAAACVAASVHVGKHERAAVEFVKRYRAELERVSAAPHRPHERDAGGQSSRPGGRRRSRDPRDKRQQPCHRMEHAARHSKTAE